MTLPPPFLTEIYFDKKKIRQSFSWRNFFGNFFWVSNFFGGGGKQFFLRKFFLSMFFLVILFVEKFAQDGPKNLSTNLN